MTPATVRLSAFRRPSVRRGAQVRPTDVVLRAMFALSGAFVVAVTLAMLAFLARAGLRGVQAVGVAQLVTGLVWKPEADAYGGLPLVVGTLVSALGAVAVGAAPAVMAALFVNELAPRELRAHFRRVMELAAAVPSVVYGWLALTSLVPILERVARAIHGAEAAVTGEGLGAAALLLGVMIGPTVALLALDALGRVPASLHEASAALGASRLQTALRVSLPTSWRGLVVAVFFGFARAAGETMAVQMVIGGARKLPDGLFSPTTTISTQIVMDMQNAQPETTGSDVLFSMALVLLVVSTGVVLVTRSLGSRRAR